MGSYIVKSRDLIVPPCRDACPAGVDAARYIREIKRGRPDQALAVIRERIPFPAVCANACYAPCEEACAYRQFGDPIAIRALKRVAVEKGGGDGTKRTAKRKRRAAAATGRRVAVVGAGPAGLTAAYYLALLGHAPTLFDSEPEPGGTMRYGIPDFRLPKDQLTREIAEILAAGVEFRGGVTIGTDISFAELKRTHDALFIACGATKSVDVPLEGRAKKGVWSGWQLLRDVAKGTAPAFPGDVLVVGGGNVAVDAARTARRLGAKTVTIVYRRTREEMPAHPSEIAAAEEEGVQLVTSWAPKRIAGDEAVTGLALVRSVTADSREKDPVCDEETTLRLKADHVILAVGQRSDLGFLSRDPAFAGQGARIAVNAEDLMTGCPGVFAGGDAVSGPASIIAAIAQGRRASQAIDRYLGGRGTIDEPLAEAEATVEVADLPAAAEPRTAVPTLASWQRISGFGRVELAYDERQALAESRRCLTCDARTIEVRVNQEHCKECGYCAEVCTLGAFVPADHFNAKGYRPMVCKSSAWCVGCMKCFYACPDFAIDVQIKSA
ncbi:MAG: FAD-dependent oxidoreductase [Syntrophales bacterium]